MKSLRQHLSFANVVALTALVFSMGGTAIAANHYLITKTSQIKPSVLKALKVPGKAGTAGAVGAVGPSGPQGIAGAEGKQGKEGIAGKNGATNVVVRFVEGNVNNGGVIEQTANCNAGERATGGGAQLWNGGDAGSVVIASSPVPNGQGETPTGWHVVWENKSGGTQTIHTYAICASP
jgi:hypothetical protein